MQLPGRRPYLQPWYHPALKKAAPAAQSSGRAAEPRGVCQRDAASGSGATGPTCTLIAEEAIAANPSSSGDTLLYAVTLATLVIAIAAIIRGHTGSGLFLMIAWYIAVLPPLVRRGERSS